MVQSVNTLSRFDLDDPASGDNVREDLTDVIYNISPTEVPAQSNFGRGTSSNTLKEWQIDELVAAANNAHIDGDEFAGDALDVATRLGNYHQISRKDIVVSRRANIVNKAGRKSEVAYQIAKKGKELRRDVELSVTRRHGAVLGSDILAPEAAGIGAWLTTNIALAADGAAYPLTSGIPIEPTSNIPNAGTARALSEADVLNIIRSCYDNGGNPNMIMMPTRLKQAFSNYLFGGTGASPTNPRIATQYQDQGANPRGGVTVVGAVDVYVSDFSILDIVPNRFMPSGSAASEVYILDTEYWEMSYLDGYRTETIAKIGDHDRRMLLVDWTLCSLNEAASGVVGAIDDTEAVTA